ncbi:hypothetical protein RhiirA4_476609, partial [Rhizophagus irregularis]
MFRRNNTYQLNNPLKLRQRYSHIPLHYRNINPNSYHVTNDKSLSIVVDNNKGNDNFENILPSSEKDNGNIDDDNADDNNNENGDDNNEGDDGNNVENDDHDDDDNDYYNEDNDNYYNEDNDCNYRDNNEHDEDDNDYYNEDNDDYYDDEDGDVSIEDGDEQHNSTGQIVDEAMDSSKLPTTNAYDDLVSIINDPQFKQEEVVTNIRRFRNWRQRLPLLPITARTVSISPKKTPSTFPTSKLAYYLSINDIIWYVLNNPSIMKHMYFGPGIDAKIKSEFWHGSLWAESPLFGQEDIIISQVKYRVGSFIYYYQSSIQKLGFLRAIQRDETNQTILKVQQLVFYEELPGNLKGTSRQRRANSGEVWILDENFVAINPSAVLRKVKVKLPYLNQPLTPGELNVKEIIYKYKNHWKIRDVNMSYLHPAHYISTNNPPTSSIPVYKLFLDIYYDDFGTYRNVYHSLGGVYIQFGNMPANLRKLVKNHFVIGFVPFGGNFDEFMRPFVEELKQLEKGKIMNVQGRDVWVVAGLGVVTADLPQGNDLAGVLRHGASKGCRTCSINKDLHTDLNQDFALLSRYNQITDSEFAQINNEHTISRKKQMSSKYGLRIKQSILDELKREKHLQTPQDIYHATAGKIGRLLKITMNLLSLEGETAFLTTWKNFEKPSVWCRLPNPISHHESFMMSDYLRLAMIMPFILNRFLKPSHLKSNELETIQQRTNAQRRDYVPKTIIKCWVVVAKTMKIVFERDYTKEKYDDLKQCLEIEVALLTKVFEEFVNLPNLHINFHLCLHAHTYATLRNTQVGIKEMVHKIFKSMVPKTNRKVIEKDLLKRYSTIFAIRHLTDGGADKRFSRSHEGFSALKKSACEKLFNDWFVTEDKLFDENDYNDETTT